MATVKTWAKRVNGAWKYAESYIMHNGSVIINPTDDERRAAGELPMAHNAPETRDGMVARQTGYEARDGRIFAVYEYSAIEPTPRVISKLYLRLALKRRGLEDQFDELLDRAGLRGLWTDCNELNEAYEGFADYVAQVQSALGIDDETVEAILSEAVAR